MSEERSCVHPFIRRVQWHFERGDSLREAFREIRFYQRRVMSVYKVDVYFIHALAVSRAGLSAFVGYEYLRYKGFPLPNSITTLNKITNVKHFSEKAARLPDSNDPRHEEIEHTYKS